MVGARVEPVTIRIVTPRRFPHVTDERPDAAFARDAFISYANQDTAVADALCAHLERRGVSCWIAPRDVPPGALYAVGRRADADRALAHAEQTAALGAAH